MIALGIGIAALGVAIGLGLIGYSALQGMSRQPEAIGRLQTVMLIAMAFVELVGLLVIFLVPGSAGAAEAVARGSAPAVSSPAP